MITRQKNHASRRQTGSDIANSIQLRVLPARRYAALPSCGIYQFVRHTPICVQTVKPTLKLFLHSPIILVFDPLRWFPNPREPLQQGR